MFHLHRIILVMFALVALSVEAQTPKPPATRQDSVREVIHGVEIVDPYRWLEDQESPETRAWIDAQNTYTALAPRSACRRATRSGGASRSCSRVDRSACTDRAQWPLFLLEEAGTGRSVDSLRARRDSAGRTRSCSTRTLSAPITPRTSTSRTSLATASCWSTACASGGEDETELRVMDVETRRGPARPAAAGALPRRLPQAGQERLLLHAAEPRDRDRGFATTRWAPTRRRTWRSSGAATGRTSGSAPPVSENGRYLLLTVQHGWARNEVYVQDLAAGGPVTPIVNDIDAHFTARFAGDRAHHADRLAGAQLPHPRGRLRKTPRADEVARDRPGRPRSHPGIFRSPAASSSSTTCTTSPRGSRSSRSTARPAGEIALPGLGHRRRLRGPLGQRRGCSSTFSLLHRRRRVIYRYDVAPRQGRGLVAAPRCRSTPSQFEMRQVWYTVEGRHAGPDVPRAQEGPRARRPAPDAALRLRRLQRQPDAGSSARRRPGGWSRAASTRSPTCAAAASSARSGTGRGCWRRSRTSSTTSSPPPSG